MKTHHKVRALCLLILVIIISVFTIGIIKASIDSYGGAQSGVTGAVKGFIMDAKTGEVLAKVKITYVSARSSSMRYELKTDKKGYYYKGGLTPGNYMVSIEEEGYLPVSRTVRVKLADTIQVDFALEVIESTIIPESVKAADKGMKLFKEAKWDEAVKEFSEGISKDQSNPLLYFYRGLSQEYNGNIEEALVDYQKTIEFKPDFILPYSRSGKIYARQQEYEKAQEFYQKAMELDDKDVTTHYNYGVVLMNLGQSLEARTVFEGLLLLDEDYADAYYYLGIIYIGQGDSAGAKEFLQKFIEMDPENTNAAIAQKILESLQ